MSFYQPHPTCQISDLAKFYERFFGEKADGKFVEVGAYDGESWSNTSCLADLGWRGIYIEPIAELRQRCEDRHRSNLKVTVLPYAISNRSGYGSVYRNGALSSASKRYSDLLPKIAWAKNEIDGGSVTVPFRRLDDILPDLEIGPGFDLLVVDVEGHEPEVFEGFSLEFWSPKMIIVELCDFHPDFVIDRELQSKARRLRREIIDAGYHSVFTDAINTIFVI